MTAPLAAKLSLMLEARRRHGTLYRCGSRASLWDGFQVQRGRLEFWFNSADGSTRMVWAASGSSFPGPLFLSA